jgi:hypothetical protein
MSATSSAPLPALPLCNFEYVLEVYRLLPEETRARVSLREYLPFLPPPLPAPETRNWHAAPTSPFGDPDEGQTLVGYTLLAFILTSERRQRQRHRANGGRKRRRLTRHQLRPWTHDEEYLRTEGALSLRLSFARDLEWALKLGLAARRARRASDAEVAQRCHAAFASALACLAQVMWVMAGRNGGGWWMREQLKSVLAQVWLERFGAGVRLPADVYDLLRPAIHGEKAAEFAALLLIEEELRRKEPPPLNLAPEDLTDPPRDDDGDAGGTPAALV